MTHPEKIDCPSLHPGTGTKCEIPMDHEKHGARIEDGSGRLGEAVFWTDQDIENYDRQIERGEDHYPIPTSVHPPRSERTSGNAHLIREQMIREFVRVKDDGLTDYEMHLIPRISFYEGDPNSPNNSCTPSQIAAHRGVLRDAGIVRKADKRIGLTGHPQTVWVLTDEYLDLLHSTNEDHDYFDLFCSNHVAGTRYANGTARCVRCGAGFVDETFAPFYHERMSV